jgi:uncharacterized repeat protein (TIGR02543 family)
MGGFPGIGAGTSKKVSDLKLATDTIGVESYQIGADSSLFRLKNNYYDTITITKFRVNQQDNLTCNSSNTNPALPIVLNVGQSQLINCSVVSSSTYTLSSKQTPMMGITYIDTIGATRIAGNEGSAVATVSQGEVIPPETPSYTIIFNSNTGTGTMSTQTIQQGASANLIPNNFTKASNTFDGWNTLANGSGTNYSDNVSYTMGSANVTLYAKWTAVVVDACGTPGDATDPDCWSVAASGHIWGPIGVNTPANDLDDGRNNSLTLYGPAGGYLGGSYPAAKYCYDLVEDSHEDWFLPAINQLMSGITANPETWGEWYYWSSTENPAEGNEDFALNVYYDVWLSTAYISDDMKDDSYDKVRCLR